MSIRLLFLAVAAIILLTALASAVLEHWIRSATPMRQGRKKRVERVPNAGGLAVVCVLGLGWLTCAVLGLAPVGTAAGVGATVGLAAISLQDMRVGMPWLYRYTAQAIAVVIGLIFLPGAGHVFQGLLPVTLDLIATTLLWIGAIQVISWCDRQDGFTILQLLAIGLGGALVALVAGDRDSGALGLGLCMAAVAIGYLPWAWPPARMGLGAVGTVPLGYALAWLLLSLAGRGHWAAAVILSSLYLGELVWAWRRRAAAKTAGTRASADPRAKLLKERGAVWALRRVMAADIVLVGLACLGTLWPWPALLIMVPTVVRQLRSRAGLSGLGFRGF